VNPTPTPKFLSNIAKPIKGEHWIKMFRKGRIRKLTEDFIISFQHFADFSYATLPDDKYQTLNGLISQFLFIMSQPGYQIPEDMVPQIIKLGPVISNAVAMSVHQTTDAALEEIIEQANNFHKILVLYSARNRHEVKREVLFRIDPVRASQWYWSYFVGPGSYPSKTVYENMRRHVAYVDPDLQILDASVLIAYFNSTYIDGIGYRLLKVRINQLIQKLLSQIPLKIQNTPDRTIAVCTSKWYPRSAVYRFFAKAVKAMAKRHRLELVHLGDDQPELDTSDFAAVRKVKITNLNLNAQEIAKNNYSAIFFPDIGMSFESIYLSNIRLAPVQFMSYGHPSSTFGAKIDYFIGGEALEIPEDADCNYSEKLILVPGNGQPSTRPCHLDPSVADKSSIAYLRVDRVVVNCPWSQDKTTYPLVDCLRKIKERCKAPVVFRLFPNEAVNRANYFIPYVQGIMETIGDQECVEVHQAFGQDYLNRMAAGALTLDSWPFNGYNTILDSLMVKVPVVTLRGRQCFERVGAEILGRSGLDCLITDSEEEYIEKAVKLIDDPDWRLECSRAIRVDFKDDNGEAFADAVDRILGKGWEND
jgi:hypothetical protein